MTDQQEVVTATMLKTLIRVWKSDLVELELEQEVEHAIELAAPGTVEKLWSEEIART